MALRNPKLHAIAERPKSLGIARHIAVQDAATVMADYEETVQHPKGQCGHSKEIHGRNGIAMVAQKGQPAMEWIRISMTPPNPARYSALRDPEAQLQQFTMDARCSPGGILPNHAQDQVTQFLPQRLSSHRGAASRNPSPI